MARRLGGARAPAWWLAALIAPTAAAAPSDVDPTPPHLVGFESPRPPRREPTRPIGPPIDAPRIPPDYDSREAPGTQPADVAAGAARAALFPAWVTVEYGLRRPIGWLVTTVERERWVDHLLAAGGDGDGRVHVSPLLNAQPGFAPVLGVGVTVDDVYARDFDLSAGVAGFPGRNANLFAATEGDLAPELLSLRVSANYARNDDSQFYGIGPQDGSATESRYLRRELLGRAALALTPPDTGFTGRLRLDVIDDRFDCTDRRADICGPDDRPDTDDDRYAVGGVPGFLDGYTLGLVGADAEWDSRHGERHPSERQGVVVHARGALGLGDEAFGLVRYGLRTSAWLEPFPLPRRTFGSHLWVELVDPLPGREVPFTELVILGGVESMQGFDRGRFHGRSAVVGALDYRWPVWAHLDAHLFLEAGNVFGPHFGGFKPGLLRGVIGVGLRTFDLPFGERDFELSVGVGTTPLGDRFKVDEVNLNLGLVRWR